MNVRSFNHEMAEGANGEILSSLLFGRRAPGDDTVVARSGDRSVTAGELRLQVDALAARLTARGVEAGHRVAVLASSELNVIASFFAVWRAKAVVVPINPRLTDAEITATVGTTQLALALGSDTDLARHLGAFTTIPTLDNDPRVADKREIATARPEGPKDDSDVALILTTSGTTGTPKPIQLRHGAILEGIDTVLHKLAAGRPVDPDRLRPPNIIPVPIALWAGLYNVLFALRSGAGVILLDPFSTTDFVATVREHQIKSSVLAPAMIAMLTDDPAIENLAPLRIVRSITAPLSPLQARRFHDRFGVAVLNSYGQTELGGEVIGWNAADSRDFSVSKLGALGRPHAGIELRVTDGGEEVESGNEGELWVRSPYMMAGYLDRELDDRLTEDGYLRTGDIGRTDDDGFVWLSGRVSDLIIRGGLKVFPDEIEEVLRLHPAVGDVAVVGVPDERLGEVPWAFIVAPLTAGDEDTIDPIALATFARKHAAPYKIPVRFEPVSALPRNAVGKVLRRDLIARATEMDAS